MSAPAIDIDESLRMADSQVLSPAFQVHSISQPFILRLDQAQHRGMSDDELTFWNWIWRIQLRPAPDFIVEVLSPSTKNKDRYVKLHKYSSAGVREYWMIDPNLQKVVVYNLQDEDAVPAVYGFDQQVPVQVLGGECVIDFRQMYEYVRFIYDREDSGEE